MANAVSGWAEGAWVGVPAEGQKVRRRMCQVIVAKKKKKKKNNKNNCKKYQININLIVGWHLWPTARGRGRGREREGEEGVAPSLNAYERKATVIRRVNALYKKNPCLKCSIKYLKTLKK